MRLFPPPPPPPTHTHTPLSSRTGVRPRQRPEKKKEKRSNNEEKKKKATHRRHVVRRGVVEVARHVGREEPPVLDVERHVAERQQLEQQQREEEQAQPLLDRLGAGAEVEEGEAGEHPDPGREEQARGGVGGVAELGEDAALEQDAELGPPFFFCVCV